MRQEGSADALRRGETAAALIDAGRRHRSAVAGKVLGIVAEHLVHHSPVPTCAVPDLIDETAEDL
ncbi:universal stress protein [Curtobacterium sp. TC1]|uniref:universal stress protein n=1 Tax=Curtobacterium sp. TC1 TaxID=2862880 RepID=UPI003965BA5E